MNTKLLVARKEHGLTQQDLAERVGLTHPDISRIERAGWIPPADARQRLADALDTTVEALFGLPEEVAS